jgi:hypothetical protein
MVPLSYRRTLVNAVILGCSKLAEEKTFLMMRIMRSSPASRNTMTDYNGTSVVPGDPWYNPDLDPGARGAMYYLLVSLQQLTDTSHIV